jgi:superfamily II DNA/RNA helicase
LFTSVSKAITYSDANNAHTSNYMIPLQVIIIVPTRELALQVRLH